jgi:hypothetical protein
LTVEKERIPFGVVALLDALGVSRAHHNVAPGILVDRWNGVDNKLELYLHKIRDKLGENNYNNRIIKHGPYDNLQILIPVDIKHGGVINCSTRNPAWWTIHHIGELLIQLFRYALINRIYFTGCISAASYFQTGTGRVFGEVASEAAEFREKFSWLGVIVSPSAARVLKTAEIMDNNSSNELFKMFVKYSVPFYETNQDGQITEVKKETWVLNWPREREVWFDERINNAQVMAILEEEKRNSQMRLEELTNKHSQSCQILTAESIVRKWENARRFCDNLLLEH